MLLYDGRTGLPLPSTTRYSAIFRRSLNGSVSTMEHELRAIALGLEWVERNGIDLDERVGSMMLFTPGELLSLRDFMRTNCRAASRCTRWCGTAAACMDGSCVARAL